MRKNKGITLIALIITVIVMLILAGVAINMTIGDKGIFKRTSETIIIHENAEVYEQLSLKIVDDELGNMIDHTQIDKLSQLKSDGYIDEKGIVNVEAVTKRKMKTGNGSVEAGDVYGIVLIENEYYLFYLDEKQKEKNLGKLFQASEDELLEPTPEDYFIYDPATGGIALKAGFGYYWWGGSSDKVPELGLKTIVIPSEYQGQPVTKIGIVTFCEEAYNRGSDFCYGINVADVERIVLPNTITEIGDNAFLGSTNLKQVNIPNSVTKMGGSVFGRCTSLEEIKLPNSITTIGVRAFEGCQSLKELNIPNSVTEIGEYAFYNASNLTKVNIPNTITKIQHAVFWNTNLQEVTIPHTVTEIGRDAFCGCKFSVIEIPDSVKIIEQSAFSDCRNLKEIVIPNSVTTIRRYTFSGCSSLENVTIPNTLTRIEGNAFQNCTNIQEIRIPSSVKEVIVEKMNKCYPFKGWTSSQKIYVPFKEGELAEGWASEWRTDCEAQIIYQE